MKVFETVSPENTVPALTLAINKAKELSTDIILSATTGASAFKALELSKELAFEGKVIVVSHVWGSRISGENTMSEDDRSKLEQAGAIIVTAAHTLSGVERAISGKFNGAYPVEIMAHTLRMLSAGVKVCVEIGAMAMDAGKAKYQRPVVALGGTGRGLDTACVITPGYSAKIFETRVHEILCKPY